jgi:AraC-like DNA-binding protein
LGGQGWFASGGRHWSVGPGTLVFATRAEAHAYAADADDPWTLQWVHFDGQHAAHFIALTGLRPDESLIPIGEQPHISLLFSEILNVLQSGYSLHHLITISASLRQLLSNIAFLNTFAPIASGKGLHVEAVINYMLEHLTQSLSLDDFADYAAMSRSYFSSQFREKTGYAVMDYFIRLKIQKACELLETTEMKVVEISHYLGYKDPYYFSRLFKKISGISPSYYRQSMAQVRGRL